MVGVYHSTNWIRWDIWPRLLQCGMSCGWWLVTELVHALAGFLGVKKVEWLQEDVPAVGCFLPFITDTIFIRAAKILHPLDAISTTLHELGHVLVRRCRHVHSPRQTHCEAWKDATKLLTALVRKVSRIYVLLCFVFPCSRTDWIYIYISSHTYN